MLSIIMQSVVVNECRYAECRYAECRGTVQFLEWLTVLFHPSSRCFLFLAYFQYFKSFLMEGLNLSCTLSMALKVHNAKLYGQEACPPSSTSLNEMIYKMQQHYSLDGCTYPADKLVPFLFYFWCIFNE